MTDKEEFMTKFGNIFKLYGGFDNLGEEIWSYFQSKQQEKIERVKGLSYGGYIQVMASKKNYDERNGCDMAISDVLKIMEGK